MSNEQRLNSTQNDVKEYKFDSSVKQHIKSVAKFPPKNFDNIVTKILNFISVLNSFEEVSYPSDYGESDYEISSIFKDFVFPKKITTFGDFREGNLRDVEPKGKVTLTPLEVLDLQRRVIYAFNKTMNDVEFVNLSMLRSEVVMTHELANRVYRDDKVVQFDMGNALPVPVKELPYEDDWYTIPVKYALETYLKAKF